MKPIAEMMVATSFTWIYCILTVLVAALLWWLAMRKAPRLVSDIAEAKARLEAYPGEFDFAQGFSEFDGWMRERNFWPLTHAWKEFVETLVLPHVLAHIERSSAQGSPGDESSEISIAEIQTPTSSASKVRNTYNPSDYFNAETLIEHVVNVRLAGKAPDWLLGLGILGTFLGLVGGVYLASLGLNQDLEKMKEALQFLLSGASLAFFTSIVGLVTSIAFGVAEQRYTAKLSNAVMAWVDAVDRRMEQTTPEKLLAEHNLLFTRYTETHLRLAEDQASAMQKFSQDLAINLGSAMDRSLVPHLERLTKSLEGFRQSQGEDMAGAIQSMVERFIQTLQGSVGDEMQQISSALKELMDGMKTQQEAMDKLTREGADRIAQTSAEIATSLGSAGQEVQSSLHDAAQTISDMVAQFGTGIDRLNAAGANISELVGQTTNAIEGMRGAAGDMNKVQAQFVPIASQLGGVAKDLASTAERADGALKSTRELGDTMRSLLEELGRLQGVFERSWQQYGSALEGVEGGLERIVGQMDEGLRGYSEKLRESLRELDSGAAKIGGHLNSNIDDLSEVIESLQRSIERRPS